MSIYDVVLAREPHHEISLVGSGDPITHMWISIQTLAARTLWTSHLFDEATCTAVGTSS